MTRVDIADSKTIEDKDSFLELYLRKTHRYVKRREISERGIQRQLRKAKGDIKDFENQEGRKEF